MCVYVHGCVGLYVCDGVCLGAPPLWTLYFGFLFFLDLVALSMLTNVASQYVCSERRDEGILGA